MHLDGFNTFVIVQVKVEAYNMNGVEQVSVNGLAQALLDICAKPLPFNRIAEHYCHCHFYYYYYFVTN